MKLLVIGHAFLLAYIQKKYVAMKQLDPDLQLRLMVPSYMRDRFHHKAYEVHPVLATNEVVPFKARLASFQAHMTYLHNPARMAALRDHLSLQIHGIPDRGGESGRRRAEHFAGRRPGGD